MNSKKKPEKLIMSEELKVIANMRGPYDYRKTAAALDNAHKKTQEELKQIRLKHENEEHFKIFAQVKQIREELGISKSDLAKMVGTSQAYITRFENNNANPSLSFLKRIAAALGKELYIYLK